jgi:ammonia channel protein AmtB
VFGGLLACWPRRWLCNSLRQLFPCGNFGLFIAQLKAVVFAYGFVGLATAIILWILGAIMPLRVSAEQEERGLDFIAHFAWAVFYGLSVGVGGYLLFILAMQRGDDD